MSKVIGFEIEIKGTKALVNNITDVRLAIQETRKALKETADDDEAAKLNTQLVQLNGTLKNLTKDQRILQDQFAASEYGKDSIEALRAELRAARTAYDRLSRAEREAAEGQELLQSIDTLKKEIRDAGRVVDDFADDSVKGLQRNLKDLEEQFNSLSEAERQSAQGEALAKSIRSLREEIKDTQRQIGRQSLGDVIGENLREQIPILNNIKQSIDGVGSAAGAAGKLIQGGFAAFAIASEVTNAVGEFKEFVDQVIEVRRQVETTFQATGQELDDITTQIQAGTETFGTDFQETIEAANAVTQTFGTSGARSVELLNKALVSARDRGRFLGDITTDLEKLAGLGVDEESAISLVANASNLDFNIDNITKPLAALREESGATQQALVDAFGRDTAQEIFDQFQEEPLKAIQRVSREFSQLDDKSKESAGILRNVFGVRTGREDIATVKALQNIGTSLDDLADKAGNAALRQQALLEANEELGAAQNEIAKRFEGTGEALQTIGARIQTFLLNTLVRVIDFFKPVVDAAVDFGSALFRLIQPLTVFNTEGDNASGVLGFIGDGLAFVRDALIFVIDGFTSVINSIVDFINESPAAQAAISAISSAFEFLGSVASTIGSFVSSTIDGIVSAASTAASSVSSLAGSVTSFVSGTSSEVENLADQVDEFAEITDQVIAEFEERNKAEEEERKKAVAEREKAEAEEQKKREERRKRASSRAIDIDKREKDRLLKQQENLNKETNRLEQERLALIQELQLRIIDQQIANIEDQQQREIAAEEQRFSRRRQQLENQVNEQIKIVEDQQAEILRVFGAGSNELLRFEQQAAIDLQNIRDAAARLQQQNIEQNQNELTRIQESFNSKQLQDTLANLEQQAQLTRNANNRELLEQEQALAQGLIEEQAFADEQLRIKRESLQDEINLLNDRESVLKRSAELGVEISQSEFDNILTERQRLNTELAKLEAEQTENLIQEQERRNKSRTEGIQQTLGFVNQGFQLVGEFAASATQAEENRLNERQEAQSLRLEQLNEDLANASGLEKAFIEQQVREEERAAKEIADAQIENQKRAAREKKAIDIAQAAINGALAITNILANVIDPTLIGGFKIAQIAFAAATTAAQIATIAAQPLADGGIATPVALSDGKIVAAQNIPTMRNGDNVLATVKRNEVILNQRQQAALGGPRTFKAIGVPGFQAGGLVGPVQAPRIAEDIKETNQLIQSVDNLSNSVLGAIGAISNRLDRLQVVLNIEDFEDLQNERNNNRKTATLE